MEKVKNHIANGEIDLALKEMLNQSSPLYSIEEVLLLNGRFEELKKRERLGIIQNSDYLLETNRIGYDLLNILNSPKNDPAPRYIIERKWTNVFLTAGFFISILIFIFYINTNKADKQSITPNVSLDLNIKKKVKNSVSDKHSLVKGSNNTVIWKIEHKNKEIGLNFNTPNSPKSLIATTENQTGAPKFILYFDSSEFAHVLNWDFGVLNDKLTDLPNGQPIDYYFQIAEHDFDNDNNPEIVIGLGDNISELSVNIFKFYPPLKNQDIRDDNIQLLGIFEGQTHCYLKKSKIILPYGSQGLFSEYTWVEDKFVQTE